MQSTNENSIETTFGPLDQNIIQKYIEITFSPLDQKWSFLMSISAEKVPRTISVAQPSLAGAFQIK